MAWLHAIVQERLRYTPLGWSKHYEFSESDLKVAYDTIDTWIDASSQVCSLSVCRVNVGAWRRPRRYANARHWLNVLCQPIKINYVYTNNTRWKPAVNISSD